MSNNSNCSCNLNVDPSSTGNMFFRSDWEFCTEYKVGDVVLRNGLLYMAIKKSAGKYPEVDYEYWKLINITGTEPSGEPTVVDGGYSTKLTKNNSEIRIRRDTTANWEENNPRLGIGELGIDVDLRRLKVGNGIDNWNSLPYLDDVFDEEIERINETLDDHQEAIEKSSGDLKTVSDDIYWHIRNREEFLQCQIDMLAEASIKASLTEIEPKTDLGRLIKTQRFYVDDDGDLAQR